MNTWLKIVFIYIMCLFDFFHSWWGVQKGYIEEMNFLFSPLLEQSFFIPFVIKNGLTLGLLLSLFYMERFNPSIVRKALNFITVCYIAVMVLHANCLLYYLRS